MLQNIHVTKKIISLKENLISKSNFLNSEFKIQKYLSVFSPNAGKYGPEKLRIRTLFTQCNTMTLKIKINFMGNGI